MLSGRWTPERWSGRWRRSSSSTSDAQLVAIVHRWGGFYTRVAESVLNGTWKPEPVWGGIASGMVDVAALAPSLPRDAVAGLQARRQQIIAGKLVPFAAPLRDNRGAVRLARGALDDAQIKTMDWLVEGVVGNVPKGR
jgi:simple sugar transport system substrate-binding protein